MAILGTTYEDLLKKLAGLQVEDAGFEDTAVAGQERLEQHIKDGWTYVKQHLPSRYRDMLTHVPGQLFQNIAEGTNQFTLDLADVDPTSVVAYLNFSRAWDTRTQADAVDVSEVSVAGQVVTLATSLAEDSWLIIEYDYDGTSLTPVAEDDDFTLQKNVLDVAAYYAGRESFQRTGDGDRMQYVLSYLEEVNTWLESLRMGDAGIPVLDNVKLYEDWSTPATGIRNISAVRG